MIEKALSGTRRYWTLVGALVAVLAIGGLFYFRQIQVGLGITGMSRSVTWGFYIAQFTWSAWPPRRSWSCCPTTCTTTRRSPRS